MTIVQTISSILQAMCNDESCALQSWQYNDKPTANVVLDNKKPSPTALFLQITDWELLTNYSSMKEKASVNISFLQKEPRLDAKGPAQDAITDEMKDIAVEFLMRLNAVKSMRIMDDTIEVKSVYLKGDSNRSGVNISLDIEERQGSCAGEHIPSVVYINGNGTYDVTAYSQAVVNVKSPMKLGSYLYAMNYDGIDYAKGKAYFEGNSGTIPVGGCSSVRKGDFYGRNYDWYYSNQVEFLVRVNGQKHKSAGIASLTSLTRDMVENNLYLKEYEVLPFLTLDGINDAGVVVNTNVVPAGMIKTTGTTPSVEERERMCSLMLPRYILDNFAGAQEAVEYIRDYVSVYVHNRLFTDYGYDVHIMVADRVSTYILEFKDNELVVLDDRYYMTNFNLNGVNFNSDGTVYTPYDKSINPANDAIMVNYVEPFGAGLERYNLIAGNYSGIAGYGGMVDLMTSALPYTKTYTNEGDDNVWWTECVGKYETLPDIYVNSPLSDCEQVMDVMRERFASRDRNNPNTWQTVHTSVYDIEHKTLTLFTQEENKPIHIEL